MVELTVLAVPGCPRVPLLERRLAEALAGGPPVTVRRRVIADVAENGSLEGSPSVAALRQALEQAVKQAGAA